jgi:uncharacterized protein (DUF58 family)
VQSTSVVQSVDDPGRVSFDASFVARARRLAEGFAALRARESLALGAARRAGGGDELVGHRPLRAGEDARDLDWELYARLERPFVRERRTEAGERWAIVFDTSRSMGLGRPSKLQRAAEVVGGLAACGLRIGARVDCFAFAAEPGRAEVEACGRDTDWLRCVRWLDGRRALGVGSVVELCAHVRVMAARRVFVVGDLFDCTPPELLPLARAGRSLCALALLAPHELDPRAHEGAVEWVDPENEQSLALELDEAAIDRYHVALRRRLDAWAATLARHGQRFHVASSEAAFEDLVRAAL